jgi:hypothetical protein
LKLFTRALRSTLVVMALVTFAACSSGKSASSSNTTTTFKPALETQDSTWIDWNNQAAARGFTPAANAVAKRVATKIAAAGVTCTGYLETPFDAIATSYYKVGVPIPVGSGECDGAAAKDATENILIEVMGTRAPNGADLVAFKRKLVCRQAKDDGRRPDGTSDFPGLPYVIAKDNTYVVQPDSFAVNRQIAKALGLKSQDVCEGIK